MTNFYNQLALYCTTARTTVAANVKEMLGPLTEKASAERKKFMQALELANDAKDRTKFIRTLQTDLSASLTKWRNLLLQLNIAESLGADDMDSLSMGTTTRSIFSSSACSSFLLFWLLFRSVICGTWLTGN